MDPLSQSDLDSAHSEEHYIVYVLHHMLVESLMSTPKKNGSRTLMLYWCSDWSYSADGRDNGSVAYWQIWQTNAHSSLFVSPTRVRLIRGQNGCDEEAYWCCCFGGRRLPSVFQPEMCLLVQCSGIIFFSVITVQEVWSLCECVCTGKRTPDTSLSVVLMVPLTT